MNNKSPRSRLVTTIRRHEVKDHITCTPITDNDQAQMRLRFVKIHSDKFEVASVIFKVRDGINCNPDDSI